MADKWKRHCVICGKEWGNPNGKMIKGFCSDCLREIRNLKYLSDWYKAKEKRRKR